MSWLTTFFPEESSEINTKARIGPNSFTEGSIVNLFLYVPGSSVPGEKYLAVLRFHYHGSNHAQNDYINGFIAALDSDTGQHITYAEYAKQHQERWAGTTQEHVGERVLGCDLQGLFPRGGSSRWDHALQQIRLCIRREGSDADPSFAPGLMNSQVFLPEEISELNTNTVVDARDFSEGAIVDLFIYVTGSSPPPGEKYLAVLRFHHHGSNTAQLDYINGFVAYLDSTYSPDAEQHNSGTELHGSYAEYAAQHRLRRNGLPQERVGERVFGCDLRELFSRGGSSRWDPASQQIRLHVRRPARETTQELRG